MNWIYKRKIKINNFLSLFYKSKKIYNFYVYIILIGTMLLFLNSCYAVPNHWPYVHLPPRPQKKYELTTYNIKGHHYQPQDYVYFNKVGTASWYGYSMTGARTANGEIFASLAMTAAHRTLPLPSLVRVTNLNNGRSVIVRVNDRGPFVSYREIDLSYGAALKLGYIREGIARIRMQYLGPAPLLRNINEPDKNFLISQDNVSTIQFLRYLQENRATYRNGTNLHLISNYEKKVNALKYSRKYSRHYKKRNLYKKFEASSKTFDKSTSQKSSTNYPGKTKNGYLYYIQLATFKKSYYALHLVTQLHRQGYCAFTIPYKYNSRLFVVRIGPVNTDEQNQLFTRLKKNGYNHMIIIPFKNKK